jgi:hypothetical protein
MADSSDGAAARIASDGGLAPLVALLDAGGEHPVAADATTLLGHLASVAEGKEALREANAIPRLVNLLAAGADSPAAANAAEVLWVLADGCPANREAVLAAGGVAPLLALLGGAPGRVTLNSAGALCSLAEDPLGAQAIRAAGGIAPLVQLLEGEGFLECTLIGAVSLSHLADDQEAHNELLDAGCVSLLVGHLNAGPEHDITVICASVLAKLAEVSPRARSVIVEEVGIPYLVALLGAPSFHPCVMKAASTLWFLARAPDARPELVQAGALPALLTLLEGAAEDPEAATVAAAALMAIVADSEVQRAALVAAGGVQALADCVCAPLDGPLATRCSWALASLADGLATLGWAEGKEAVRLSGVLPRLVAQLDCGAEKEATLAGATALAALADSGAAQEAIFAARGIPPLVNLLSAGVGAPVTAVAARALSMMAYTSAAARDMIREAGGIQPLVLLLQAGPGAAITAKAAAALWYLARSPANKEEIRRAGGIAQLVALVGAGSKPAENVVGAKPLLRVGSPGRERPPPNGAFGRPGSPVGAFGRPGSPTFGFTAAM